MATQTVEFAAPTGQTITAKLFAEGSDTVVASAAATEATNRKGVYSVAYTDIPEGTYRLIGYNASNTPLCFWWTEPLLLVTGTYQTYEMPEQSISDTFVEQIADAVGGLINAAIATIGVETTVVGMPTYLRIQDARTVDNGRAIYLRVYNAEDANELLFGLGNLNFADAESIFFGLTKKDQDEPEAEFPVTWVETENDGYFLIVYDENALNDCSYLGQAGYTYHNWGVKVQWPSTPQPVTVVDGMIKIRPKIVNTQS